MKILLATLVLINNSIAGDVMSAGTELKENSYVFTIPEAESLMNRVFELEKKEKELEKYKQIDLLKNNKIEILEQNIEFYKKINKENEIIINNYIEINKQLEKKQKWQKYENAFIFASGIATSIFLFLSVDYINDNYITD